MKEILQAGQRENDRQKERVRERERALLFRLFGLLCPRFGLKGVVKQMDSGKSEVRRWI